jgi:hypothetical protein
MLEYFRRLNGFYCFPSAGCVRSSVYSEYPALQLCTLAVPPCILLVAQQSFASVPGPFALFHFSSPSLITLLIQLFLPFCGCQDGTTSLDLPLGHLPLVGVAFMTLS